jgi:putative copper resistance protein D
VWSFAEVLLRAAGLASQALAVGGVAFAVAVLGASAPDAARRRTLALAIAGTAGVAVTAALHVLLVTGAGGWSLADVLQTAFGRAAGLRLLAAIGLGGALVALARRPAARALVPVSAVLAGGLALTTTATGHAAAQAGARAPWLVLDAVHQVAASVWVGGLVHLLVARRGHPGSWPVTTLRRFSWLALGATTMLVTAGVALAGRHVGDLAGLLGTAYGIMVLAKALMLAALLAVAAASTLGVRADHPDRARLRALVEVEVGLTLAALVAAASLTALPPAIDVRTDRAAPAETAGRFAPRWPTLTTPSLAELAAAGTPGDPAVPRTDLDRAWSEYNHNLAGLALVLAGIVASLEGSPRARWARHWPAVLVALAAMLFVRSDPEAWPLGAVGPWASLADPEVLQHRALLLLAAGVAAFEWLVRTGHLPQPGAALVFPLLCVTGAPLLLVHGHAVGAGRDAFFMEVSHAAIALFGLAAGWGRWLELRLPHARRAGWRTVWSLALVLAGLVLVFYRER